ncbi:hypothetical protein KU6B_50710 [Mameliella alba]|nr:hypothetical protein KU6B_50710 [Mameliella alba]
MCGNVAVQRLAAESLRQRLGPRSDPQAFQENTLRGQQRMGGGGGGSGQGLEIDMGGEVGLSGGGERVGGLVPLQGLQGVAKRAPVAIVDDQSKPAMSGDSGAKGGGDRLRRGAGLDDVAVARVLQPVGQAGLRGGRGKAKCKRARIVQPDDPFLPGPTRALELAHRQRVKELVGDKEDRPLGQILDAVMPCRLRQAAGLFGAQLGRGFDKMQAGGVVKAGHAGGGAQDVGHQGAATGAKLCQDKGRGRPLVHPALRQAQANQFAEHLADFRRGCKIARRAQRVTRAVIAVLRMRQAGGHEVGQRHRPVGHDLPDQDITQCGQEAASALAPRARFRANQIVSAPPRIIGRVSSCPIVRP